MAKKKDASASPFVPAEEQPYKIPDNWCWVKLESISQIIMGQSPNGADTTEESSYMPLIGGASDMGALYPHVSKYTKVPTKISASGDLILCIRATLGKPIFSDGTYCLGRGVAAIRPYIGARDFYRYFFLSFEQYLYDNATGTTFAQVNSRILCNMPFPLPPLPEQQRIVSLIESLFAKLDEAKEKAQAVVDGFELRKSAILHKAFTGELTARWRKKHGVGLDSWEHTTLESVCKSIFDGDHMPPPKADTGIPFLVISNVNTGYLTYENTRFVSQEYYNSLSETRKPEVGDVLYTLVGSFGIPVIVDNKKPFCFQRHMALLKPDKINSYFLWYLLQSSEMYNKAASIATGTAQLTVPIKGLRKMTLLCPSNEEQKEVVYILNNILNKEAQALTAAEAVLDQIDSMKKAILARAFRGELGTNDPAEEWAGELLKRILAGE